MFESSGVINILDLNKKSIGTGFFVSERGLILTCFHVLDEVNYTLGDSIKFCFADCGDIYSAVWIESSNDEDIAILKSNVYSETFYKFSSSVGYEGIIESFGYPNGKKNGIYAKAEVYAPVTTPLGTVKTQLGNANDITHGFSGAPMINSLGNVIGMISDIPKKDENNRLVNIAFAIPSSKILNLFSKYFSINSLEYENEKTTGIDIIGRKFEISKYSSLISSNKVTIIQGMAGVGKTTLAEYLFREVIKSPKLWITIRKNINNELETVLYDISEYLEKCGYVKPINMFNDLKNRSQTYAIALLNLQNEIIKCVLEINLVIFIDDAHFIDSCSETTVFFKSLIHFCSKNKFVFITRHSLSFVSNTNNTEPLRGLLEEDCKELIRKSGLYLSNAQIHRIYEKTQGNAKFLEICIFSLLESDEKLIDSIINNLSADFNLNNYIQGNIVENFTNIESKILNIVALCRKPISFDVIIHICNDQFEPVYYAIDKFVRYNIIEKTNNDMYGMHALLKGQFSKLTAFDNLLLHKQIAENISSDDYIEISYHYFSCGRFNKALNILISKFDELISSGFITSMYNQILHYKKQLIQNDESSQYYYLLGKLLTARGQYDSAINTFKEISKSAEKELIFYKYIQLSQCYEKKGEYADAFDALKKAEYIIAKSDIFYRSLVDINRGFLLCHQEKISVGITLCERGLKRLSSQSNIPDNLIADGYNDLGWNYIIKGDYDKAETVLSRAIELYNNNARGEALAKIRLARIYWQKGKLINALDIIKQAKNLSSLTGDPQLQAFALRQENLILWNFGEFDIALEGHKMSLKQYSKIKDYWGISASLENVAAVLYDLENYSQSMIYINNAINICKKINATDFLAYAYLYKARILNKQGNLSESKKYAYSSIKLLSKWKYSNYYLGMALISLGLVHIEDYKYINALAALSIASFILSRGNAIFQKHISDFYKYLCLEKIIKTKKHLYLNKKIIKCYEYFESISATKNVKHLKKIEKNLRSYNL